MSVPRAKLSSTDHSTLIEEVVNATNTTHATKTLLTLSTLDLEISGDDVHVQDAATSLLLVLICDLEGLHLKVGAGIGRNGDENLDMSV